MEEEVKKKNVAQVGIAQDQHQSGAIWNCFPFLGGMRPRISKWVCVRPSVRASVGPSVTRFFLFFFYTKTRVFGFRDH